MKASQTFLFAAVLVGLASPSFAFRAFADDAPGTGLPSDFGPVSIEASRRALQARMQDWADDRADIKTRRILSCALAGAEAGLLSTAISGIPTSLTLLEELPSLLAAESGASASPLTGPLARLASQVRLTSEEQARLQRLMSREVSDASDRIRLFIDTESFLMQVSSRLYQERIDAHLKAAEGISGLFRADFEHCAAYTIQTERDDQLLKAADRVLAYYGFLEQELAD